MSRHRTQYPCPSLHRCSSGCVCPGSSTRSRLGEAVANKIPYTDFLALLIADEVADTRAKKFNLRIRLRAGFRSSQDDPSSSTSTSTSPSTKPSSPSWPPAASSPRKSRSSSPPCGTESPTSHKPSATPPFVLTTMCCSPPRVSCWQASMPRAPSTLRATLPHLCPCRCSSSTPFVNATSASGRGLPRPRCRALRTRRYRNHLQPRLP